MLNFFKKIKSLMEFEEGLHVLLPVNEVLVIIEEIEDLQEMILSLNLA
jgi:hypothetical protein